MIREVLVAALLVRSGMAAEVDPVKTAVAEVDAAVERLAGFLTEQISDFQRAEAELRKSLKGNCSAEGILERRIESAASMRRAREEALVHMRVLHADFVAFAKQASIPSESQKELLKNLSWVKQETIRRLWEVAAAVPRTEFVEPVSCKCFSKAAGSPPRERPR